MKTRNQYEYCYKLCDEIKEKYGNNLLQTELNIGYENLFVIATILIDKLHILHLHLILPCSHMLPPPHNVHELLYLSC